MTRYAVGDWIFEPDLNELRRGNERRRLEHRSARTLELLCSRADETVTLDAIIAQVWNGRAVSPNSVPVVISDLRQALEDDAREPRYIETVAKRGYRLIVAQRESPRATHLWRRPHFIIVAALVLALAAVAWTAFRPVQRSIVLVVTPVQNGTGDPAYLPLVNASSAVLMAQAEQLSGVQVYKGTSPHRDAIKLDSWLYISDGRPRLMMAAYRAGGPVLWTGVTAGGEQHIPPGIAQGMRRLGERLNRRAS